MAWRTRTKFGKWFKNVCIGVDQFANAFWGGDPDETISSRLGKLRRAAGGTIERPLPRAIDKGLDRIDPGHSIEAIEEDEGKDALVDRGGQDRSLFTRIRRRIRARRESRRARRAACR
jgi:hypothetical protein